MFGLIRMVAWTMTAIVMLLLFPSFYVRAQERESESQLSDAQSKELAEKQASKQVVADRYEKILTSRPQLGTAFDKFYEFYAEQGTLAELCQRLELTAKHEESSQVYQLLGLLQLRRGLLDDAVANLKQAQTLQPKDPFASLYLSRALSLHRQYPPALAALKNAADNSPSQPVAIEILKEFRLLHDHGIDREVSAQLLSTIEKQFAASPLVNEKLADCYVEIEQFASAITIYEKLVDLTRDPLRRIEIRMQIAGLKKRLGDPKQALAELELLVDQVKPQSWLHTSLLGQIENISEELEGGQGKIAYYERALSKRPADVPNMLRLANVLRSESRMEESQSWIAKAIAASPNEPEPLLAMVDLMETTKQFSRASTFMQKLVQLDANNVDYLVRWGQMELQATANPSQSTDSNQMSATQQSNAAAIWRRLLVDHEKDTARIIQLAELLRSISLQEEAIKLYQQAIELSDDKVECSELLAEYLLQINRREEARTILQDAMESVAENRESLSQLSQTLLRFKFNDDALVALERASRVGGDFSDLLQLARLQSENTDLNGAVETLLRSATKAENASDFAKLWDMQTVVYKQIGTLPEMIQELERKIKLENDNSADSLMQLAMMQSANNQPIDATTTAALATKAKPEWPRTWLLNAKLQREAGLNFREIESLHTLCKLDEKHATDYLERIATIQFQLSQVDQALATMEQIFDLPGASLQHFQLATSFCLQAKKPDQAVEFLRRATQAFPKDRSAWFLFARQQIELKDASSALEAAWHVLEQSRDEPQQREALSLLASLHQSDFSALLSELKQFGVKHDQESEANLWSLWVLLDSGKTQNASEVISKLLEKSDAQPELLRAAMDLAERENNYTQAVAIMRRLRSKVLSADTQLKLGQLLWLAGDTKAAESEWMSVMRSRSNDNLVSGFAKLLVNNSNWNLVANFVHLAMDSKINNWELAAIGIFANVQNKNLTQAVELSGRLLEINLSPDTPFQLNNKNDFETASVPPTAIDRLEWLEQAGAWQAALNVVDTTRAGYRSNQSNPRASQAAAVRYLAMQRGAALRSNQVVKFNIQCFAEARALAVLAKFGRANQRHVASSDEFTSYLENALRSKNVEQLWDCVLVMEPASNRDVSFSTSGAIEYREENSVNRRYGEVLDALVALDEPAAVELAIHEIVLRRQLQYQLADRLQQQTPPMDEKELARLQSLVQKVDRKQVATTFSGHVALSIELMRSQRNSEAKQVLASALGEIQDVAKLATCARQSLTRNKATQQVASQLLLAAFEIELKSNSEGADLAFAIATYRDIVPATETRSQDFLFEMIRLQAKDVESLPTELRFSDSRTNESRRSYRNFRPPSVAVPDRSSMLSTSLRAALLDSTPEELSTIAQNVTADDSFTPAERTVRYFIGAIAHALLNEPDMAFASLTNAKEQSVATDILELYEVWLHVVNQKLDEAVAVLNRIEPSNDSILRECELWKMDLAVKLGDTDEAQRAARVLTKLPLSVQENAEVAVVLKLR